MQVTPPIRAELGTVRAQVSDAKIPISAFPTDLHSELVKLDLDHDGCLDAKEIEVAMRVLLNERKGRISVKAFDPRLEKELIDLGADEEGYLGFRQIEEALLSLLENKKQVRQMKWALVFLLGAGAIFLAAVFGLVYAVVDLTKDMRTMNGVLVDRITGKPLATGSSIYTLGDNGALMPIETPTASKSRRSRRDGEKLAPGDGTAVKTSILTLNYELNSEWDDGQLQALKAIMTSKYGGFMSANVQGLVVFDSKNSSSSSNVTSNAQRTVIFETSLGRMMLKGNVLSRAEGIYKTIDLVELHQKSQSAPAAGSRRSLACDYSVDTYTAKCCACMFVLPSPNCTRIKDQAPCQCQQTVDMVVCGLI